VSALRKMLVTGIEVIVSEFDTGELFGSSVLTDLYQFKDVADVMVANRKVDCLRDVDENIFFQAPFGDK
tara:strand:- start:383 stop:589 length:207 start_codon:yes stop_codon:yes gene_type:complete